MGFNTKVIITNLKVDMMIGIHPHEQGRSQPVIVNLEAQIDDSSGWHKDDFAQAVCYEALVKGIRTIATQGHINLVETFAERIASFCLQDTRINCVTVRVGKPAALSDTESVGVEIFRKRA